MAGKKPNARAHSFGRVVNEAAAIGVVPMAHGAMPASAHWRRLSLAPDPAPQRQPDLNETHPPGPSVSSQPHRVVMRVELNVPSPGTPRNHARLALRKTPRETQTDYASELRGGARLFANGWRFDSQLSDHFSPSGFEMRNIRPRSGWIGLERARSARSSPPVTVRRTVTSASTLN